MRQIVDSNEWQEVVDPAWGIALDDFESGYEVEGWEASAWILHAMYENEELPAGLSLDEADRIERTATGTTVVDELGFEGLSEASTDLLEGSTLTGIPLGGSSSPGPEWERLRWADLAKRLGFDLLARFPTPYTFPLRSWPVSIRPPAEGSLDLEQFERLLSHLGDRSSDGPDTECIWWYSALHLFETHEAFVYRGSLRGGRDLYSEVGGEGSPNNFWPLDRSWFVWTDWDYLATKVSGSHELVEALLADPDLEVLELE